MAVYIDDFNAPFGRMSMCHMVADSTAELLAMCDAIGVQKKWIQYPGTKNEHFDICLSKKAKAVKAGAIEIGMREYAKIAGEREIISVDGTNTIFQPGEEIIGAKVIRQNSLF